MHCTDPGEKRWWQERLELAAWQAGKLHAREEDPPSLERLTAAEGLERYLHTKYVGQKRFSASKAVRASSPRWTS
jgi:2-oxoglutarate dehydrogenase E1 component